MSYNIEDCVKDGLLEQVSVRVPSDEVFTVGDKRTEQEGGKRMTFGTCTGNSVCVVKGMEDKGESDWQVVGGFAFFCQSPELGDNGPVDSPPIVVKHGLRLHVWVKKGDTHFDPTWSRHGNDRQDISPNSYFALTDQNEVTRLAQVDSGLLEVERGILYHLEGLAEEWDLEGLE